MNRWASSLPQLGSFWLLVGLITGVTGSGLTIDQWLDAGAGTRVQVLGAGKQLSVLISHKQRRVLIAAGSDSSAFSNAIGDALPPMFNTIDVLLIDPSAPADVVERARSLAAKQWFLLPGRDRSTTAQTVNQAFAIDLGDDVLVIVRPQEDSWTVQITTKAGIILVSSGQDFAGHAQVAVNLDGTMPLAGEVSYPIEIQPEGKRLAAATLASVSPGDVLSIAIAADSMRLDRDFFPIR